MNSHGAWVHPTVRAVLLIGFAAYIAYLVKSDHMLYYISPRMTLYVKLAALGLYAVGAYQLYAAAAAFSGRRELHDCDFDCDCGHEHHHDHAAGSPWKSILLYGLFAFPLLLGFCMPDMTLGSALAAKKGMNLSSAAAVKTAASNEDYAEYARALYPLDVIPVPEELYIETITTLDLYADQFAGKTVKLSGFVYRDDSMNDRQFVIGRFSVECCSADAAPFGVLVQSARAGAYATDQWVEVTGTLGKSTFNGDVLTTIVAERITAIEPPKEQYVYPNYGFGSPSRK